MWWKLCQILSHLPGSHQGTARQGNVRGKGPPTPTAQVGQTFCRTSGPSIPFRHSSTPPPEALGPAQMAMGVEFFLFPSLDALFGECKQSRHFLNSTGLDKRLANVGHQTWYKMHKLKEIWRLHLGQKNEAVLN